MTKMRLVGKQNGEIQQQKNDIKLGFTNDASENEFSESIHVKVCFAFVFVGKKRRNLKTKKLCGQNREFEINQKAKFTFYTLKMLRHFGRRSEHSKIVYNS